VPAAWKDAALEAKWEKIRDVRRVVTGALEIERAKKTIGSSLEAVPVVYVDNAELAKAIDGVDMAEIAITSGWQTGHGQASAGAFALPDVPGVAVIVERAEDRGLKKCARSWRYTADVGSDREFPEVSARDAEVLHELQSLGRL
jgi:isoleucyl-tRNA synthetase